MPGTDLSTAAPAAASSAPAAGTALVISPGGAPPRAETAQPPLDAGPFGGLTPRYVLRFAGAVVLFSASMHYLVSGRKEASVGKMMIGAALAFASLLLL